MGIKGSPTCVLNFDKAKGYLVGEREQGTKLNVYNDEP